jgi:carbon monoxide dehydrogenase subunit G
VKVEGERSFDAPRATVWRVLQDPAEMADLMPGVESFEVEDDRHWKANVKIPLGLGSLGMSINFEKLEEREPEFSQLRAKGTGVGALMNLLTQFHLSEVDSGTAMTWEADVRIAGPVGSMGQRVLRPIVNQQVQLVLTALDARVARASGEESTTDPETKDAGPAAETTPEAEPAEQAGSSGAEEGRSPLEEESYSDER